jgi:signal transduction histidine kinase
MTIPSTLAPILAGVSEAGECIDGKHDASIGLERVAHSRTNESIIKPVAQLAGIIVRDSSQRVASGRALQHGTLEAEAAVLARSEFLANMSQEIRTGCD